MASNLKRSKRTVGKRIDDLHRRVLHMQKRPAPRRIGSRVIVTTNLTQDAVTNVELAPNSVTSETIVPGTITNDELAPGTGGNDTSYSGSPPANPSIGDVWFDTGDSLKLKRWDGTAWVSMRDLGIAAAAAGAAAADEAAAAAQSTADGKNKVYRQAAEPTGATYAEGDLWFDTDDNNKVYRRTGSAWTAVVLGGNAIANIDAGSITAGTIAAARITSTSISAANITAAQITSGTISSARITSDSISAANINADNITVGTLTGRDVNLLSGANGLYLNNGGAIDARYGSARILVNNADQLYPFVSYDTGSPSVQAKIGNFFVVVNGAGGLSLIDSSSLGIVWYVGDTIHGHSIDTDGAWFDSSYASGADNITFQSTRANGNRMISARANGDVSMAYLNSSSGTNIVRSGGILYLTTSTIKIKENVEYVEDSMLDAINLLKPVRYTFKRSETDTDFSYALKQLNKEIGFIVEDIEEVQQSFGASLLNYDAEDLSLIDIDGERTETPYTLESDFENSVVPIMYKETAILAICVKAIQELTEKVKDLESRIS